MNVITVIGRLTADPTVRTIATDETERTVATLPLAIPNPGREDEPCFVDVTVWGALAQACGTYLHRGRRISVTGRLSLDRWTDGEGQAHQRHRIVAGEVDFLDRPRQDATAEAS